MKKELFPKNYDKNTTTNYKYFFETFNIWDLPIWYFLLIPIFNILVWLTPVFIADWFGNFFFVLAWDFYFLLGLGLLLIIFIQLKTYVKNTNLNKSIMTLILKTLGLSIIFSLAYILITIFWYSTFFIILALPRLNR